MSIHHKIKGLEDLASLLSSLRAEGKTVVQCHGVFDLLHVGHIRHFGQARKHGDILVVTVTPDRYVNKGFHRPAFTEDLRAEAIAALDCVDYVAINKWPTAVEAIKLLTPDIYAKGTEYKDAEKDLTGKIVDEEEAIQSVGGKVAFTDDIVFSSSNLINKYLPAFPKEVREYLPRLLDRYSVRDILKYLSNASSLKVLVVGEAIIDEYRYCETMGKSGKEPILAARHVRSERFAGGVLAVANHVAAFCDRVDLLTLLGKHDSQEGFIRQQVAANVNNMFLYMENAPTIVKQRFVEIYPFQKLFEVYVMGVEESDISETEALCAKLKGVLPQYDVVIVADYGHGMLNPEVISILCGHARFLAINTQINAGNHGFNTVAKYPRADYICVSAKELRLDARSRVGNLRGIVLDVAKRLSCDKVVITQGQKGCLCYGKEEGFLEMPAFATKVVDRVGAGDAVFAVSALCAAQQAPMEVIGFIGSVVGAEAVATVGNKRSIERVSLFKHIESLLK
ncbi:MAG TPA: cytidyltransferase [Nitrospirales bacterium]|nr:cytidyltransferase [Nitrospirales bacterium]